MRLGYARVSTTDQDLALQTATLQAAGCEKVYFEKASGTSRRGRPALNTLLDSIRPGDCLCVTRIDRLARSLADLMQLVALLNNAGATLLCTEQNVGTATASERAFLQMLGVFAEFETNLRHERQAEGIAKAKAAGKYKGRRRKLDASAIAARLREGFNPSVLISRFGCSRSTVYRVQDEMKKGLHSAE